MPTLQIEGVGRVEVDDTFLSLAPSEQDAVIADILASARPRQNAAPTPTRQPPAPTPPMPSGDVPTSEPSGPYVTPESEWTDISDADLAAQEAAYQASLLERAYPKPKAQPERETNNVSNANSAVLGFVDSLTFGFGDEIDAGIGAVLGGPGYDTIWSGKSWDDAYGSNVKRNRDLLKAAQEEDPWYYAGGGLASAAVPISAAGGIVRGGNGLRKAAQAAEAGAKSSKAVRAGKAAGAGAVYGGIYGLGTGEDTLENRLEKAGEFAKYGAAGGVVLDGVAKGAGTVLTPAARKLLPKLDQSMFAKEQAGNSHLLTDAAVADDLDKIVQSMMVDSAKRKLSPSQKSTLLSRVNDLEVSYLPRDEVKSLDLPPSVKAKLNTAMAKRHLLSDSEVQSIRDGSPAGEAVADGIEKARRLRAHVTETSSNRNAASGVLGEALGSAAGWKVAGPVGGALGGRIGRATMRSEGQAAKEALAFAENASKFAKLPEVQAAREGISEGTDSLARMSADALDEKYLASKAAEADTARLEAEGRKVATANARDNIVPSGGWRGLIYERTGLRPAEQDAGALAALKDGAISQDQFDAFLDNPALLMRGNAGNSLIDRMAAYAESGRLNRDPKWKPRPLLPREAELMRELDDVDPVRGALADGIPFRDSEVGMLQERPADLARAAEIRAELNSIRAEQAGVRNPAAYEATARANQQRVTDTLSAVQSRSELGDVERETLASAVTAIGNTSSREAAERIVAETVESLGENNRAYARSLLVPLVQQIRR